MCQWKKYIDNIRTKNKKINACLLLRCVCVCDRDPFLIAFGVSCDEDYPPPEAL